MSIQPSPGAKHTKPITLIAERHSQLSTHDDHPFTGGGFVTAFLSPFTGGSPHQLLIPSP